MTAMFEDDLGLHDTTEVYWGTGTILAVFFAACLISAVFFGLGYSFGMPGRAISQVAAAPAESNSPVRSTSQSGQTVASPTDSEAALKPAVIRSEGPQGSPSMQHVAATLQPVPTNHASNPMSVPSARQATPAVKLQPTHQTAKMATQARIMVQVGAVVHRTDADRLVAQLRKKGFHAAVYPGKHDKYLHVQIGPYASEQQAQSMRHRIVHSGYQAILKGTS